ncbi:ABC protein, subfamily ABCG [Daphnia pulex]|uniref:ABC protein, subfamily ABCG n=1 Tax=Daphnia pulex TaxID=6669 RepID=E9G786_DAPPU|nr:ABC protein, subfamily ABCG [Daphnia pulex]|eukprot:EFX84423.1 ABC protein, subfamily ABCG [Daphnia pulex]
MDHTPSPTSDTSSSEFSSADFTPSIGKLFQQPNLAEKQAEEIAFLSLTRPSSHSDRPLGATLTWRDLSVYVTTPKAKGNVAPFKRVLNNVRGALQPGSLVALMGASGAGKSTLLNALACRCPPGVVVDGEIRINGRLIDRSFCDMSGYVYQDDIFVGSLTAREHLLFTARLKMNGNWTPYEQNLRVKELLTELGLIKCQNVVIGEPGVTKGLSGGERKRLAFASQVLTDPAVLFCDEPTTGLDTFSAERLVMMLKDLTQRGKTVVCTIHQPSSETFAMFDRLVLLAEGRIAYQGSSSGALGFFESMGYTCPATYNPADFYVQTLAVIPGLEDTSRSTVRAICDRFIVTSTAKQIDLLIQYETSLGQEMLELSTKNGHQPVGLHQARWTIQFLWLVWRAFVDSYRNPAVHTLRILQKIAIALLAGLCFHGVLGTRDQKTIQNIQGALFILTTENTFPALYGALGIFPMEWPLFLRDARGGLYSPSAYYLSKVVALIPGYVVETFVFVSIAYWLMGLKPEAGAFLYSCWVLIVTCNTAAACGTFFSAACESIAVAISFLIPFDYILFITGGVLISLSSLPEYVSWTKYLSWFLYTNEALSAVQWQNVTSIKCDESNFPCLHNGQEVMKHFSFDSSRFSVDITSMLFIYCTFHLLGLMAIVRRSRS